VAYRSRIFEFLRLSNAMAHFGTQNCDFSRFLMFFVNCDVTERTLCGFYVILGTTFGAESISGIAGAIYCELTDLEREVTVTFEI
jgi:hypothetical protein